MTEDTIEFSEVATLIVGLVALFVGTRIRAAVPILKRMDMPDAVIGAMIVALLGCSAATMSRRLRSVDSSASAFLPCPSRWRPWTRSRAAMAPRRRHSC